MIRHTLVTLLLLTLTAGASAGVSELNSIAAIVDDDVITAVELEQKFNQITAQLRRNRTPLPDPDGLRRQVLERLIVERLQLAEAKRIGIQIDDEELNRIITNIATNNQLTLEQFRQVLAKDQIGFAAFREEIRSEVTVTRLRTRRIDNRVTVSEQEVDNFLLTRGEDQDQRTEYRLAHILISVPEAASPDQVQAARRKAEQVRERLAAGDNFAQVAASSSDGQQSLEGGDLGWRKAAELPTLFIDQVASLAVGGLSELIRSPSGYHILQLLDKRGEQRHFSTQTHARHILIRTTALVSDEAAERRLLRLRQRILDGEAFDQLARLNSADPGSGSKGGDLGWASPGQFVPAFESVMNGLKVGEISLPFKSQFGWHLMEVLERREQDDTDAFKRTQIKQLLHKRKVEEETELWLRRLRDEAYVDLRLNS